MTPLDHVRSLANGSLSRGLLDEDRAALNAVLQQLAELSTHLRHAYADDAPPPPGIGDIKPANQADLFRFGAGSTPFKAPKWDLKVGHVYQSKDGRVFKITRISLIFVKFTVNGRDPRTEKMTHFTWLLNEGSFVLVESQPRKRHGRKG